MLKQLWLKLLLATFIWVVLVVAAGLIGLL